MKHTTNFLMDFIMASPSSFHVIEQSKSYLESNNFLPLEFSEKWELKQGNSYYTIPYGTTLFAFTIGEQLFSSNASSEIVKLHIANAHTDFPCLRIKSAPEWTEKGYLKLNTSVYGGPILSTWLDRPLSIAGKVSLKSNDIYHPTLQLVQFDSPLLTIPNLAIHMNHEINKGHEYNKQTELIPILGLINDTLNKEHYFLELIAKQLGVPMEHILDFDLTVYNAESPCLIGINKEFLSAPRLDNLTSVAALLQAIVSGSRDGINLIALYDNEEVGSRTKQGADSMLTSILLEKLYKGLSLTKEQLYNSYFQSMMLSVDVAHGIHPNYVQKSDPTLTTFLGKGTAIKIDVNQKYASDTEVIAILQQLCIANKIPYQKYNNRSDIAGGSTLGSIISSWLPIRTADIGIPLLAMHSARELMATKDQEALEQLLCAFFTA